MGGGGDLKGIAIGGLGAGMGGNLTGAFIGGGEFPIMRSGAELTIQIEPLFGLISGLKAFVAALAVSIVRKDAGVSGQRELVEAQRQHAAARVPGPVNTLWRLQG